VAKRDTTSINDALNFSVFLTCSLKATRNDCKCLNVLNRNLKKTFQNNSWLVDGHEV